MFKERIEEIELNITQAKAIVDRGAALERLRNNRDFKKVVLEGYFEKEAIRLVHLKSDFNMQSAESQANILDQINAIGALSGYFNTVRHQGMLAEKAILSDEETRDELLAEGIEE